MVFVGWVLSAAVLSQGFDEELFMKKVFPTETDKGVLKQDKAGEKTRKDVISGDIQESAWSQGSTRA